MMRSVWGIICAVIALAILPIVPATAQSVGVVQSDILVLDPDRLFLKPNWGNGSIRNILPNVNS